MLVLLVTWVNFCIGIAKLFLNFIHTEFRMGFIHSIDWVFLNAGSAQPGGWATAIPYYC